MSSAESGKYTSERQEKSAGFHWSSDFSCISCMCASSKFPPVHKKFALFYYYLQYHSPF